MPFTLAHPAAVLPFWRSRLHFPALLLGSVAPDFGYFLAGRPVSGAGHTLWGCGGWAVFLHRTAGCAGGINAGFGWRLPYFAWAAGGMGVAPSGNASAWVIRAVNCAVITLFCMCVWKRARQ